MYVKQFLYTAPYVLMILFLWGGIDAAFYGTFVYDFGERDHVFRPVSCSASFMLVRFS